MGGAQRSAATLNNAVPLAVEVDAARARRRKETRYLDQIAKDLDQALSICQEAIRDRRPRSIAVIGNAADVYPELVRRGLRPHLLTPQKSPPEPLHGYISLGLSLEAPPHPPRD